MTDATPSVDPLLDQLLDGLRYNGDTGLTLDTRSTPRFLAEVRKLDDRARFRDVIADVVHLAWFLAEKRKQPAAGDDLLRVAVALVPTLHKLLGADASGDWSEVRKHLHDQKKNTHNPTTAEAMQPPGVSVGLKPKK